MKIYNFLIPLLFFAIGITNVGKDLFGKKLDHYAGDLVDSRFNNAILEHDYRWLRGWNADLWDPPFFYPAKNTLAGSDNHLGTFGFYALYRIAGLDMFRSFEAWIFTLFVLNFFVCWYVLKKLGFDSLAVSIGAFIFSFSMPVVGQLFHVQTLTKFAVPLIFLYLKTWFDLNKLKHLVYTIISWAYLSYCSLYFALLILPFIMVFSIIYLAQKKLIFSGISRKKILASAAIIASGICMVLPLYFHYHSMAVSNTTNDFSEVKKFLPGPISYLTPVYGNYWWSSISLELQTGYENAWLLNFFPGIFPLTMIIAMFFYWRNKNTDTPFHKSNQFTLLFSILFFTVFFGYSLFSILNWLPGYGHLKVVGRFYLIALFFIAVSIAFFWKYFLTKKSFLIQFIIAGLVVVEQMNVSGTCSYIDYELAKKHHLPLVNQIESQKNPEKNVFVQMRPLDQPKNDQVWQVDAMMASLTTGIPTLNGYSTATPPNFEWINTAGDSNGVKQWLIMNNWDSSDVFKKLIICK